MVFNVKMIFIFIAGSAFAAEPDDEEDDDSVEEIVATGFRAPRDRASDPLATKVVDREDIGASGAEDAADLLEQVPGVDVQQSLLGTEIRLQGFDPDQILILVDAQRMNGRVGGALDLSRIPVESIERIEIVEGTASALYGADAMGVETLQLNSADLIQIDLDNAVAGASADGWEFSMDTWNVDVGAGVEVAMTEGTYDDFDSLCQAPPSGFASGAGNLTNWYLYSGPPDHSIDPQNMVFFFHTSDGACYRLKFNGYYEQGGDLHTPSITFGPVAPPICG